MEQATGMTAQEVENALRRRYLHELPGWALLREVTIEDAVALDAWHRCRQDVAFTSFDELQPITRRIDVLLIRTSARGRVPHERIAVEVKVSRADFRRDTDEKRRAWRAVAHRFAYAAPAGLIRADEVPPGCGLLEVDPHAYRARSGVEWAVRAPRCDHEPEPFTDRFVAYLAGRASRAEHELRRAAALHDRRPA